MTSVEQKSLDLLKHLKTTYDILANRMELMSGDSQESIADLRMWGASDDPIFDSEDQTQLREIETILKETP